MKDFLPIIFLCLLASFVAGMVFGEYVRESQIENSKAASYYKGCIVIGKENNKLQLDSCGFGKSIVATEYELSLYNLGDTIK